eukprot:3741-Heterococcus_DN1.PRE.1
MCLPFSELDGAVGAAAAQRKRGRVRTAVAAVLLCRCCLLLWVVGVNLLTLKHLVVEAAGLPNLPLGTTVLKPSQMKRFCEDHACPLAKPRDSST